MFVKTHIVLGALACLFSACPSLGDDEAPIANNAVVDSVGIGTEELDASHDSGIPPTREGDRREPTSMDEALPIVNLAPKKRRAAASFNQHGRSVKVKVEPGAGYYISFDAKLNGSTLNSEARLRLVIVEDGKKGMRMCEWINLSTDKHVTLAAFHEVSHTTNELTVILNPSFPSGATATYQNLIITKISGDDNEVDDK